ncbi:F0F1 ATP synthase subunit epsilon [Luteimicrobium subarcticum]|uniref:ATP synthase epsilon chain n=1 Tax=Luteimicrobium subarcticum TaxID=620910 RepID=A0A2M8W1H4_9MICO|nr:F0F1 ATP synthase subunit epsilon [Luteimicrobium subarcticum]PJI84781.1 ATP synthase F1 subcomplex epsilon subunit [Luteimicrobium subarcticum]
MAELDVDLVAADRTVWSGKARLVVAPAADGEVGVMAGHTPLLSVLKPGTIRIRLAEGGSVEADVDGGFISVDSNTVTAVVDGVVVRDVAAAGPAGSARH